MRGPLDRCLDVETQLGWLRESASRTSTATGSGGRWRCSTGRQARAERPGRGPVRGTWPPARRLLSRRVARVFVITGPSGVGKGTLIRGLMERLPQLELSVSATTRSPRAGERDGERLPLPQPRGVRPPRRGRRVRRARRLRRAQLRHAALRARRPPRAGVPVVLEIEVAGGAPGARGDARGRAGVHRAALARGAAHAPDRPRHRRRRRRSSAACEVAERELAAQPEFGHVVVNDRLEDALAS